MGAQLEQWRQRLHQLGEVRDERRVVAAQEGAPAGAVRLAVERDGMLQGLDDMLTAFGMISAGSEALYFSAGIKLQELSPTVSANHAAGRAAGHKDPAAALLLTKLGSSFVRLVLLRLERLRLPAR